VASITVHGRTADQMFKGEVDLEAIRRVVESVKEYENVPVIGNGDIKTEEDAAEMIRRTGCDGVMIGREALRRPWIFRDVAYYLVTGKNGPQLSRLEKLAAVERHFDQWVKWLGEAVAVRNMRARMSWYSAALQPWPGLKRRTQEVDCVAAMRDLFEEGKRMMEEEQVLA
jgi:tRNA-dihydrouridine synthase B